MPRLSSEDIRSALLSLPGWTLTPEGLRKQYHLHSYADAMAAITRVGFEAEAANHHPDIHLSWKRVTFTLAGQGGGAIGDKDLALARRIEALLVRF
ncbi:MAG TPA: 4a-hydroxytetrahydrobiopterin dehydratase [Armatimonadota bacterium]|nr:4a-hydroxytetrahydrobiopterin dehydratase [Armatimonadota bacterium]